MEYPLVRKLQISPINFELSAKVTEFKRYEKTAKVEIQWTEKDNEPGDLFRITLNANKAASLAAWLQELSIDLTNGGKKK